jgi:PTH2 family peptidyl-tRNA hydrolase
MILLAIDVAVFDEHARPACLEIDAPCNAAFGTAVGRRRASASRICSFHFFSLKLFIMAEELADFGFPESLCTAAMQQSFLTSTEERVEWILSNIDTGDELERSTLQQQQDDDEEFKMVILIRSDLGMSPGKVASQCVHAALGCVRQFTSTMPYQTKLQAWELTGEKVVCLRCDTLAEMQNYFTVARSRDIPVHAVHDAGRTEIAPGSITCLAIGPDTTTRIDGVTGTLRLY